MDRKGSPTTGRFTGRMLIGSLLAVVLGTNAADSEFRVSGGDTLSGVVMAMRHSEVRKLRKPFLPVRPTSISFPSRLPEPEMYRGETVIPELPEMTLDFREQSVNRMAEAGNGSHPSGGETLPSISRAPDNRISLKEEMVALNDLDIGKLGGMVCSETSGKRGMRGFLRIPTVWGTQLHVPDYLKRSVSSLVEGMNRYSEVRTEASPHLYLGSERIFRMPFLFITADTAFELTPTERHNFAEYLKSGGFAFLDNATPEYENNPAGACLRKMVRDALGSRARFEPLPVNHPLYYCWFDFNDGPPQGAETYYMQTTDRTNLCGYQARAATMQKPVFYLEGIFIDGRMVGVYSNKGYSRKWVKLTDNIPQLKMGVNLVMYALTREGGMNAREMARYSDIQGKKR